MPEFRVVHTNAVYFTLPAPLQLWGRSGRSVARTADIAPLCNKDESKVHRRAARAYAHAQYEHIGPLFVPEAQNYCSMSAESNVSVTQDRVGSKSSVGIC
jgi:hypothetical protein